MLHIFSFLTFLLGSIILFFGEYNIIGAIVICGMYITSALLQIAIEINKLTQIIKEK